MGDPSSAHLSQSSGSLRQEQPPLLGSLLANQVGQSACGIQLVWICVMVMIEVDLLLSEYFLYVRRTRPGRRPMIDVDVENVDVHIERREAECCWLKNTRSISKRL